MFPERNSIALNITCMTCREASGLPMIFFILFETFIPGAQNAFFVSKLLDRAKYCLEIPYESHLGLRFFLRVLLWLILNISLYFLYDTKIFV